VPEGDTIHRSAAALDRALAGRVLVRFEGKRLPPHRPFRPGTVVTGVEARGKHCLVHFDDGRTLHTHMRMSGSWHLYRPGERWQRSPGSARAVVEVAPTEEKEGWVAVCFAAPVVELLEDSTEATGHLGPDLCRDDPDLDEAVCRMGELSPSDRSIGDALLDQRVASGIGNVYKCEACFAAGVDPATPVRLVDEGLRRHLLDVAGRQLRANLGKVDRDTTTWGGLAVYGRSGRPCRRCGTPIVAANQGRDARITYWCPSCQPSSTADTPG
jgi:endonuclease-8